MSFLGNAKLVNILRDLFVIPLIPHFIVLLAAFLNSSFLFIFRQSGEYIFPPFSFAQKSRYTEGDVFGNNAAPIDDTKSNGAPRS
jgi:hypothetical protein